MLLKSRAVVDRTTHEQASAYNDRRIELVRGEGSRREVAK